MADGFGSGVHRIEIPDSALKQQPRAYPQHSQPLRERHGLWTLHQPTGRRILRSNGSYQRTVTVRCDCGYIRTSMAECDWRSGKATHGCRSCVIRGLAPASSFREHEGVRRGPHAGRKQRAARTLLQVERENTRWELDRDAQAFVEQHPNGGTLDEVGQFFGLTRERVRQIEAVALRKLRLRDNDSSELAALLDALREREHGPRDRGTGINRHALTLDELPTLGFDR